MPILTDIKKAAHHILRNLVIKEVSSVDRGAGEGVKVMLSKRAKTVPAELTAYMKRIDAHGMFPIANAGELVLALKAYGQVAPEARAQVKKHIIERAGVLKLALPEAWRIERAAFVKALEPRVQKFFPELGDSAADLVGAIAKDVGNGDPEEAVLFDDALKAKEISQDFYQEFWEATDTLRESICSILCDDEADKDKLIDETLAQFTDHLRGFMPEDMKKALTAGNAAAVGEAHKGVEKMDKELLKRLGLPETATAADVIKALDEEGKKMKADADKKVEKLDAGELTYMAKMAAPAQEAFQAMSKADRAKKMKDEPADEDEAKVAKALATGDAFKADDGTILTKRDFPTEAGFNFAKGQAAKLATQAADIAKRDENEAIATFAKRATDLGFVAEFGETLRKAYKGDVTAIGKLETEIKALREQARVGKVFDELGHGGSSPNGDSAYSQIMAKAQVLKAADPKLTIEQAFEKAFLDPANVDLKKRYATEAARS